MNKLLIFSVILIILYFSCMSYEKFTDILSDSKKNIHDININNEKYFIVAFSQLNNKVKDVLVKNNLSIFSSIFGNQLSAIVKFITKDKDLIPINDPILLIKYDTLKLLTDNSSHIVLNKNGTPLYNDNGKNIDINRKLVVKDDVILLVSDLVNQNSSINFQSSKIDNKFINVQRLDIKDLTVFLAKTGKEKKNITF